MRTTVNRLGARNGRIVFSFLWGTLLAGASPIGTSGCGSDKNQGYPFPEPTPTCAVPEPPPPLDTDVVVGDGTAASCTAEALRSAIAGGGNVSFDCGQAPIVISPAAEISVSQDTRIDGGGTVTLDGGGQTRILHSEARVALTVMNLTFQNGDATVGTGEGEAQSGGAIRVGWLSTLNVFDCVFKDNRAAETGIEGGGAIYQSNGGESLVVRSTFARNTAISGGAIDNLLSPLTVVDSTFLQNESLGGGGAIYDDGASAYIDDDVGGDITICGCHFAENIAVGTGGAVYLWAYPPDYLSINRSSFIRNAAYRPAEGSALGGAVRTGNAPLQIANCLFAENHADVHGGAYWTRGNFRTAIVNSTFYRNTAGVAGGEGGYGGALSGFNMELTNLTFVENHAEFTGGAVSNEESAFTLHNSIFLDNSAANEWGLSQTCAGTMTGANNIQWPAPSDDNDPPCTADTMMQDPRLGPLSENGGPTNTIPLQPDSPARDAGEGCPQTDARGFARQDPCDLGAYELQ